MAAHGISVSLYTCIETPRWDAFPNQETVFTEKYLKKKWPNVIEKKNSINYQRVLHLRISHQPIHLLHSIKSVLCNEEEGPVSYIHEYE